MDRMTFRILAPSEGIIPQIHSEVQAREFGQSWTGDIDHIRFERDASDPTRSIGIDVFLACSDRCLLVLGIRATTSELLFPSILSAWSDVSLLGLASSIQNELDKGVMQGEIRQLRPFPSIPVENIYDRLQLPGFSDHSKAIDSISNYLWTMDKLLPGSVLDYGTGCRHGAAVLAESMDISAYMGVVENSHQLIAARNLTPDRRFEFSVMNRSLDGTSKHRNIICFDVLECSENPYSTMTKLANLLLPDGVLLLKVPQEEFSGSHTDSAICSNWNRARLQNFASRFFDDVSISMSSADDSSCKSLFAVLKKPKMLSRKITVLKRRNALGDVIWVAPIARQLHALEPETDIVVMTQFTEVFASNPDCSMVFSMSFKPEGSDTLIDLDGAYERRRHLHLLDAYALEAGIVIDEPDPRLYPHSKARKAARQMLEATFLPAAAGHVVAIHAAASSPDRIWPANSWNELIRKILEETDAAILLVGSSKDFDLDAIGLSCPGRLHSVVSQLNLAGTAAILGYCDLLICLDSGLAHVAAAMGTPTLVLYGMAHPETRLPFRAGAKGVLADIECQGCLESIAPGDSPVCRLGKAQCMERISVDEIYGECLKLLAATPPATWRRRIGAPIPTSVPSRSPILPYVRPPEIREPLLTRVLRKVLPTSAVAFLKTWRKVYRNYRNHSAWVGRDDLRLR